MYICEYRTYSLSEGIILPLPLIAWLLYPVEYSLLGRGDGGGIIFPPPTTFTEWLLNPVEYVFVLAASICADSESSPMVPFIIIHYLDFAKVTWKVGGACRAMAIGNSDIVSSNNMNNVNNIDTNSTNHNHGMF